MFFPVAKEVRLLYAFRNFYNNLKLHNKDRIGSLYQQLETVISEILTEHIKGQGKPIEFKRRGRSDGRSIIFDVFAQEGFDNFKGPTVVDFKAGNKSVLYNNLFKILKASEEADNILFILLQEVNNEEIEEITAYFNSIFTHKNITIWDINSVEDLIEQYRDLFEKITENVSSMMFNKLVKSSIEDNKNWKRNRDDQLHHLKQSYENDDLVLFLGAGTTVDANIASWETLIWELLVSLLSRKMEQNNIVLSEKEEKYIIETIKKESGQSPLQLVRYIRRGLEDKETFTKTLTEILYKEYENTSDLLKTISRLCAPVRGKVGINAVVTYNFDDLLEENLTSNNVNYKTIYREGVIPEKDELGIYHVHGFLPREAGSYENLADSLLVFSEEGYHNLMSDPYHWSNLTQLNFFREKTCLFIGVSLTDPNIRRLLEIVQTKKPYVPPKHYIILKRKKFESDQHDPNINEERIREFEMVNCSLKEDSLRELGVNIIWVDDFKEIQDILGKIKANDDPSK